MSHSLSPCPSCGAINRVAISGPPGKAPICGACKTELGFHEGINELNPISLERLLQKSPLPVVVDFWAPWCGPCRAFAPTYQSAAQQLAGKLVFAKVNTENFPDASQRFSVRGIPTLVFFENGKEKGRQTGALPLPAFLQWLNNLL